MPKTMMTIMMMMMMMMMIMTDPFTTNLVVKGPVVKGSVVKGAHPISITNFIIIISINLTQERCTAIIIIFGFIISTHTTLMMK